jgi:hypothetical protein
MDGSGTKSSFSFPLQSIDSNVSQTEAFDCPETTVFGQEDDCCHPSALLHTKKTLSISTCEMKVSRRWILFPRSEQTVVRCSSRTSRYPKEIEDRTDRDYDARRTPDQGTIREATGNGIPC